MQIITIKKIAEMSDEEIFNLSMPRPGYPEQQGFMLSLQNFENKEEMAECMSILMSRLIKVQKK